MAPSGTSSSMLIGKMSETVDGAISIISSEFGSFIQTSKEDMYDILSDIYDGKLKHDYETRAHGAEYVQNPCLNLFAATTTSWLHDQPPYVIEGGFSARAIFVHETTVRQRQLYYWLTQEEYDRLEEKLVHDLGYIGSLKGEFKHDSRATANTMEEWYQVESEKEVDAKIVPFLNRKHVHVHKVAMLLSLAERDDLVINMTHFETAKLLLDAAEERLAGIYSGIGKNQYAGDQQVLLDYLKKVGKPVPFLQLQRRFWQDIPGEEKLRELLGELVTMGYAKRNGAEDLSKKTYEYLEG